jgi:prefoldin subunit 5
MSNEAIAALTRAIRDVKQRAEKVQKAAGLITDQIDTLERKIETIEAKQNKKGEQRGTEDDEDDIFADL